MAYNSDGYIMIDFTEVDFRRTNQTIEGLYKRCVDVIGTNKFILVINANGRTPLPATCSFTNNQYVIDTCIYMFAISSNDNLFIRRNDVPASDIIDDSSISVDKTWSSNKIDNELDGKADVATLADYQPLLTAVSPISIENDNISVDLSGKQDVLTAGDNISIVDNVISASGVQIKQFEYTGSGTSVNNIQFPEIPTMILSIQRETDTSGVSNRSGPMQFMHNIYWGFSILNCTFTKASGTTVSYVGYPVSCSFNNNTKIMVIANDYSSTTMSLNGTDIKYKVFYI